MAGKLPQLLIGVLLLLYPALVYYGLERWGHGPIALLLLAAALIKLVGKRDSFSLLLVVAASLASGYSWLSDSANGLKFYPVLVSAAMLCLFGASLWQPRSLVEQLARLREPELPVQAIAYCRKVTWAWCGFFVVNGAIALYSTCASDAFWALYNGLISYLLMGLFAAAEYLIRRRVIRQIPTIP